MIGFDECGYGMVCTLDVICEAVLSGTLVWDTCIYKYSVDGRVPRLWALVAEGTTWLSSESLSLPTTSPHRPSRRPRHPPRLPRPQRGMMSIPANDAFTLGLQHDPASPRIALRSSTKIPFVSSPKPRSPSASSTISSRRSSARQMSVERQPPSSPYSNGNANGSASRSPVRQRKRPSSSATASPPSDSSTSLKQSKPSRPPVDWEIPRKTLHSSIGTFCISTPFLNADPLTSCSSGFLTLYLYASNGNPRTVVYVLSAALAFIVPCDILRFRSARFEKLFERCVGFLMRESEKVRAPYIPLLTIVLTFTPRKPQTASFGTLLGSSSYSLYTRSISPPLPF